MNENRLTGSYPVIGIRPIIDARRGSLKVRESLEEQTVGMAKAAFIRDALLVLRRRDDGYGSHDDKGRLGF